VTPDGHDEPAQPIDQAQWKAINSRLAALGVIGRGAEAGERRLRVLSHMLGRPVTRGGALTVADAQLILDTLAGSNAKDVIDDALRETGSTPVEDPPAVGEPYYDPTKTAAAVDPWATGAGS
jgi:hypothetical protein